MTVVNRHLKYLVLDTETGGFSEKKHDMLSIGYIVTTKTLRVIEKGEILVKGNPRRVTKGALKVNGINLKEHNKVALTKREAVKVLDKVISRHWEKKKPTLIGQNVPFDIRFMKVLYKVTRKEFTPDYTMIDLRSIWQGLIAFGKVTTANSKQDTILDYLGKRSKRHSALVDAENVLKVLRRIKKYINIIPRKLERS